MVPDRRHSGAAAAGIWCSGSRPTRSSAWRALRGARGYARCGPRLRRHARWAPLGPRSVLPASTLRYSALARLLDRSGSACACIAPVARPVDPSGDIASAPRIRGTGTACSVAVWQPGRTAAAGTPWQKTPGRLPPSQETHRIRARITAMYIYRSSRCTDALFSLVPRIARRCGHSRPGPGAIAAPSVETAYGRFAARRVQGFVFKVCPTAAQTGGRPVLPPNPPARGLACATPWPTDRGLPNPSAP